MSEGEEYKQNIKNNKRNNISILILNSAIASYFLKKKNLAPEQQNINIHAFFFFTILFIITFCFNIFF